MITVSEALDRIFDLASPMPLEHVPIAEAAGRVLSEPIRAMRDQPPFPAAAMDGYALRSQDAARGSKLLVIGEAAAGRRFAGRVDANQAVRIFTGAPVPEGADHIVIQENATRHLDTITLLENPSDASHIRPQGADFSVGYTVTAPRRLGAADLALLAAMNTAELPVARKPVAALMSTGDELVMPGESPGPDQIVASNVIGLKAMIESVGAIAKVLPIAGDNFDSLRAAFLSAKDADLIVTIGGASVGDHDLVEPAAAQLGLERAFHKVAMRPGKPLMAGRMDGTPVVGLPGNPVSSMICCGIFILPLLEAMLGLGAFPRPRLQGRIASDLAANGPREHYMRATLTKDGILPFARQDSALLTVLSAADCVLVRPVADPARRAGDLVDYILFDRY